MNSWTKNLIFSTLIISLIVVGCLFFVAPPSWVYAMTSQTKAEDITQGSPAFSSEKLAKMEKAARLGVLDAQTALGMVYLYGLGRPKDELKAFEWLKKAATQGHAVAQNNLSLMYYHGWGVEADSERVWYWLMKSANQGYAIAQFNVGRKYAIGEYVEQDLDKAIHWYEKAVKQGDYLAQFHINLIQHQAKGMEHSPDRQLIEKIKLRAEQGEIEAQFAMGVAYLVGQEVPVNRTLAAEWLEKAAKQGYGPAQYNLGLMYFRGEGVVQNVKKANEYFLEAAIQGNREAQIILMSTLFDEVKKGKKIDTF